MIDGVCIIREVNGKIIAEWKNTRGRPRTSLVAYTDGYVVQWRTSDMSATIGTVEVDNDGTRFLKIPLR